MNAKLYNETLSSNTKSLYFSDSLNHKSNALSFESDYDVSNKFKNAFISNSITQKQLDKLKDLHESFVKLQKEIDPDRLDFVFSNGSDDELILKRYSSNGVSKLILHDDGCISFWFISYPDSLKSNIRLFFNSDEKIDFEELTFKFLSY